MEFILVVMVNQRVCVLFLTVTTKLVKNYYISLNYHNLAKLRSKSCWVVGTFKPYLLVNFFWNFMHSQAVGT